MMLVAKILNQYNLLIIFFVLVSYCHGTFNRYFTLCCSLWQNEKDFVLIQKGNYSYSNVGYSDGENIMTIDENSLDYPEILHLFFHSFGIVNEDNHPEREQYVQGQ